MKFYKSIYFLTPLVFLGASTFTNLVIDHATLYHTLIESWVPISFIFVVSFKVFQSQQEREHEIIVLNEIIEDLQTKALYDPLTKLPNRHLFNDRLNHMFNNRETQYGTYLYIDVNDFKPINDTYGHVIGDKVLQEIARLLQVSVRPGDTVARIGGDEFAMLISGKHASSIVKRIIKKFPTEGLKVNGKLHKVGISVGGAKMNTSIQKTDELVKIADRAMYRAKLQCKSSGLMSGHAWGGPILTARQKEKVSC